MNIKKTWLLRVLKEIRYKNVIFLKSVNWNILVTLNNVNKLIKDLDSSGEWILKKF